MTSGFLTVFFGAACLPFFSWARTGDYKNCDARNPNDNKAVNKTRCMVSLLDERTSVTLSLQYCTFRMAMTQRFYSELSPVAVSDGVRRLLRK